MFYLFAQIKLGIEKMVHKLTGWVCQFCDCQEHGKTKAYESSQLYFQIQLLDYQMVDTRSNNFISKFHSILQNPNYEDIIKFDQTKTRIMISNKEKFQTQILPFYFRHKNFRSFMRQLNLYGFKKVKTEKGLCFSHPVMSRGDDFQTIVALKKLKDSSKDSSEELQQIHTYQQKIKSSEFYKSAVQGKRLFQNLAKAEPDAPPVKIQEPEPLYRRVVPPGVRKACNLPNAPITFMIPTTLPCRPFIMNCFAPGPI